MHRVRLLLPYLRDQGWEAEVLAVDPADVAAPMDAWLGSGLPSEVSVRRVRALGLGWCRIPGLGTLTFRALGALCRKGDTLLKTGKFDLVYFSTTQFGIHVLGPRWKQKFGVPFIMDYQDPWVSDYYRIHPHVTRPGGRLKYWISERLHRRQEPGVLRHCAGITSVSAEYPRQMRSRYRWLLFLETLESGMQKAQMGEAAASIVKSKPEKHVLLLSILPFPGDERDLTRVRNENVCQNVFSPDDDKLHWVYVGVCIPAMALAVRAFFFALNELFKRQSALREKLRIHFIGTSYAPRGSAIKTVEPIAEEFRLTGSVTELTDRIPYSEALRCLLDADALIVPGSDDPGYTASKIYPNILARKPLLVVFHEASSVVEVVNKTKAGTVVTFRDGDSIESVASRITATGWLDGPVVPPTDWLAFEPYTAREMTRRLCRVFDTATKNRKKADE